ncbi:MAG: hypothetical protein I8H75_05625 [Myxococcaceae bacterium]|nr:hypothetical protein [Myxococcaceae bacterium]MBH2006796.1 hypothetical protein [Myxococcaceae bacterium]
MIFAIIFYVILFAMVKVNQERQDFNRVMIAVSLGYWIRIFLSSFLREISFFTHGTGGDWAQYELSAEEILGYWQLKGVQFVTNENFNIGSVPLPPNMIALVSYLSGGYSRIGSESIIAFCSCLICFFVYKISCIHDIDRKYSFKMFIFLMFSFTFLYYTSDLYKDAYVVFFVVSIFCLSFSFLQSGSIRSASAAVFCLIALWQVRPYMVLSSLPVFLWSLVGGKALLKSHRIVLALPIILLVVSGFPALYSVLVNEAQTNLEHVQSIGWHSELQAGGSGVDLSRYEGSILAVLLRVTYTLFSPFPWQGGSMGLQIAKFEILIWYYVYYQAWFALRRLRKKDLGLFILFILAVVPITYAYSLSFSNIGLIVRQRLPIVFIISVLGVWGKIWRDEENTKFA